MFMKFKKGFCISVLSLYMLKPLFIKIEKICQCILFNCRYWCSTKVDSELKHIVGQGNWGFCRESCQRTALVATTLRPTATITTKTEEKNKGDFSITPFLMLQLIKFKF